MHNSGAICLFCLVSLLQFPASNANDAQKPLAGEPFFPGPGLESDWRKAHDSLKQLSNKLTDAQKISVVENAIQQYPYDFLLYLQKGNLLFHQGRFSSADEVLSKSIELQNQYPPYGHRSKELAKKSFLAQTYLLLALSSERQHKLTKANSYFELACNQSKSCLHPYAQFLKRHGKKHQAKQLEIEDQRIRSNSKFLPDILIEPIQLRNRRIIGESEIGPCS